MQVGWERKALGCCKSKGLPCILGNRGCDACMAEAQRLPTQSHFWSSDILAHVLESHLALFHCMWWLHFPRHLLHQSWASLKTVSVRTQGSRYSHCGHADLVRYGGKWNIISNVRGHIDQILNTLQTAHRNRPTECYNWAFGPHLRAMNEPGHSLL